MTTLLITGSRGIKNSDWVYRQIDGYLTFHRIDKFMCGGADGVDSIAIEYARKHRIEIVVVKPEYDRYGRGAPLIRDEKMARDSDEVLALWDGVSKGTLYTIEQAHKYKKPIVVQLYGPWSE